MGGDVVSGTVGAPQAGGRARILQVARAAFVERGYAAVSMQELADAAGLTKAAIYYHFRDKQELFEAVVIAEMERIHQGLAEQIALGPPLRSQLERIVAFALGVDRGDRLRLIEDAHRYCARAQMAALRKQIATPFTLLRDAFAAARARGEIGECNLDLVLALFVSMVEGQIKGSDIGVVIDLPPEDLARALVGVLMDGIAAPPGTPGA
ncbi:MAG: helix-turn-helix domain-containing protein [Thermomicrobiales bacterium]